MVVPLDNWPIYADDTGTKTDGTIVDEELLDSIKLAIQAELYGVDPSPPSRVSDIVTEVIDARDGELDLHTKLELIEAAINGGSAATVTQLTSQIAAINWAANYDLSRWTAGAAAAPDDWTLTGAGASVARTGSGEVDTYSFLAGKYTLKMASGGIADAVLTQTVLSNYAEHGNARGRIFSVTCKCNASSGQPASITVDDGVDNTSDSHPNDGLEHDLVVNHPVNAGATGLTVKLTVGAGTHQAYFGGFHFSWSDEAPSDWSPGSGEATLTTPGIVNVTTQEIGGQKKFGTAPLWKPGGASTFDVMGVGKLNEDSTVAANGTTVLTDLRSYTLPASTLNSDGRNIKVYAGGSFAANANNKSINFVFGATTINLLVTTAHNGGNWFMKAHVMRNASALQRIYVEFWRKTAAGVSTFEGFFSSAGETSSNAIVIKMQAQSGTASSDIIQNYYVVETG